MGEWNGNKCLSSRSRSRSATGGWIVLAFLCLRLMHLELIFHNVFRNPIIHNFCWRMFLINSAPSCRLFCCVFSNRSCTTGCFAVENMGFFALYSRTECFRPPFTRIVQSSSIKGDSLAMFNIFEMSLLFCIDFQTCGKLSFWTKRKKICFARWISSALSGPFCFVLNLMQ